VINWRWVGDMSSVTRLHFLQQQVQNFVEMDKYMYMYLEKLVILPYHRLEDSVLLYEQLEPEH
jgi:hypothetical protein